MRCRIHSMDAMTHVPLAAARTGDVVAIVGHAVGDASRTGEILSVEPHGDVRGLRVRWEDGRVSILFPGPDLAIHRPVHAWPRTG
jgi:Domain of unknown function (DUF1918)